MVKEGVGIRLTRGALGAGVVVSAPKASTYFPRGPPACPLLYDIGDPESLALWAPIEGGGGGAATSATGGAPVSFLTHCFFTSS